MQLAIRAGAVRQTLANLKQQQARMGLGVRSDFVSAEQRLAFSMDEAEAAIKSADAATANRQLEAAERSLGFLEDKLGR
jgi:hypothetical protein